MGELDGKAVVITGAGAGMGRACCEIFVREGARVLGADVSGKEQATAEALGGAMVAVPADISQEPDVEAMMAAAVAAFGKVDAVLNVAAITSAAPLADVTVEDYERITAVNLRGMMLGTKHAIRTMLPTGGGVILNWASAGGLNASRMPVSVYGATKAGVISFTKSAAVEYGRKGIRANAIVPGGIVVTDMSGGREGVERFPQLLDAVPLRRACEPEEVAELASFLVSDRAPYINGSVITIDGGQTAVLV